jgi:class 3 adenylate cyclase
MFDGNQKLKPETQVHKIENRSPIFNWFGHAMAVTLGISFCVVLGLSVFQFEFWQKYFFQGVMQMGHDCQAALWLSANPDIEPAPVGQAFKSVSVPHFPYNDLAFQPEDGKFPHVEYRCESQAQNDDPQSGELAYIHWGWILGKRSQVFVNDALKAEFRGYDKPAVTVLPLDWTADKKLHSKILLVGETRQLRLGLASAQPAAVVFGSSKNARIFGIETALQNVRMLTRSLPLLTLALVMMFGWYSGIRMRSILTSLFYFTVSVSYSLVMILGSAAVDRIDVLYRLGYPLQVASNVAFLLFAMEIIKYKPRAIYPTMKALLFAIPAAMVALYFAGSWYYDRRGIVTVAGKAVIVGYALRMAIFNYRILKDQKLNPTMRKTYQAVLGLLSFYVFSMVTDLLFLQFQLNVQVSLYLEIILPIICGGVLLYSFSLADKKFQEERHRSTELNEAVEREKMRSEILGNFLSEHLVSKFRNDRDIHENFKTVLNPRHTTALLFQADIRGFSRLTKMMKPTDLVAHLQRYYQKVVDEAQHIGQVKIIGDCVFIFVEKDAVDGKSETLSDCGIRFAKTLIAETLRLNAVASTEGKPEVVFGIAIHVGDVVVGNLSSDRCIDYTVIGNHVNFVARLEEMTKNPAIKGIVGENGLVLSDSVVNGLTKGPWDQYLVKINLRSLGIEVRSFPDVTVAFGMSASNLLKPDDGFQDHYRTAA